MDHTTKVEDQKEVEKKSQEGGAITEQHAADRTKPGGENAPADRDAGTLDHGETGGNFGEDGEGGGSS